MSGYVEIVEAISEKTGGNFRAASPYDLTKLKALGLPESVLNFYENFEPAKSIEEKVRLWPIEHILEENEALAPGCYTSQHGYIVFASTVYGDAYCFDLTKNQSDPAIVLVSHEVIHVGSTKQDLVNLAKPIAKNLKEFLTQFLKGEVDEECIYD
jgi:hypothetical protein